MGPQENSLTARARILILGDVHYPEHKDDVTIDLKDRTFPAEIVARIAKPRLVRIARELAKYTVDATLVLGDLTTRADMAGYGECVEYLADLLHWRDKKRVAEDALHIVPGNHDIDRSQVSSGSQYAPIRAILDRIGRDVLPVTAPRMVRVPGQPVTIWSLDSCVGCGTQRGLPNDIAEALRALPDPFDKEYEGLDTPGLDDDHIEALIDGISGEDPGALPIVAFHHNLLPQYISRIAPYTELINGGYLRGRLLQLKRPVVVVHGHLHSSVLEQVVGADGAGVYCLSAPRLSDGFDILDVHFSAAGPPLGFSVQRFRVGGDAQQTWQAEEVTFARAGHTAAAVSPLSRALIPHISDTYSTVSELRGRYIDVASESPQNKTVATAIEELRWARIVEIADHAYGWPNWRVRKVAYV